MKLGEICETSAGGTPLKSEKAYYAGGDIPWLLSGEVNSKNITLSKNFISRKGLDNSSAKVFPPNTVLVAMYGATAGQVGILRFHAATNQAVCGILPNDRVIPEYLYYLLLSKKSTLVAQAVGNAQPNISQQKIRNTEIELPPLIEQKRIVAMLDEAFADIDKARELAEQNLKNTRELFESYLHHQLTPHNDWCVSTLGEVSEISYGYTDSASYEVLGPKFLRITDIKGGSVDWDSVPLCQISSEDYNKHKLKSGDIVFARTGATTGKSYLVENPPEAVAASYLIRVRLDQERVNPRYVRYFFETRNYWDSVNAGTSGSAQGGFNASKLANLEIYFPTELDTQDVLIEKLEIISRMIEDVNKVYLEKLKNLNELKSGLFSKVFSRG